MGPPHGRRENCTMRGLDLPGAHQLKRQTARLRASKTHESNEQQLSQKGKAQKGLTIERQQNQKQTASKTCARRHCDSKGSRRVGRGKALKRTITGFHLRGLVHLKGIPVLCIVKSCQLARALARHSWHHRHSDGDRYRLAKG